LDEVFVKINGKFCYLWRAVDHEGEVLETVVTTKRDTGYGVNAWSRVAPVALDGPLCDGSGKGFPRAVRQL
jgi:hypothetical protein